MKVLCISSSLALFMATSFLVLADDQPTELTKRGQGPCQRLVSDPTNIEGRPGQRRPGNWQLGFGPEQMAERMIEEFDADGDEKLNATELLKMVTTMHERHGAGMQRRPVARVVHRQETEVHHGGEEPKRPPVTE